MYVAHNAEYRPGLCKLGYTTRTPEERLQHLNEQVRLAKDIGEFQLIHSVAIPAAFDAEQRLFTLLEAFRHAPGREFFEGCPDFFVKAVDGIADDEAAGALYDFVAGTLLSDEQRWPYGRHEDTAGRPCIFVARNPCHKPDTFRLGWTEREPIERLKEMNVLQRRYTSQIGFYRLLHAAPTTAPELAAKAVLSELDRFKVSARKPFIRVDSASLFATIESVVSRAECRPERLAHEDSTSTTSRGRSIKATTVSRAFGEWAPWAAACPACGVYLRFTGAIGAAEILECPECDEALLCEIGSRGVRVASPRP